MPHKHVEVSQTGFQGRPHDDHEHLKVHRLDQNRPTADSDKSHYLMTWLAEIHVGKPILGHFFGPTVIYVINGDFQVEDRAKPGQITKLAPGDVIHIDADSYCTWSSDNIGKAFGVCYAPSDAHPEDIAIKQD